MTEDTDFVPGLLWLGTTKTRNKIITCNATGVHTIVGRGLYTRGHTHLSRETLQALEALGAPY